MKLMAQIFVLLLAFLLSSPEVLKAAPALSDEELLHTIQEKAFLYFVKEANQANGLIRDRASNFAGKTISSPASIAAVGFGLTAYGVGVERGWMSRQAALIQAARTLEFFWETAPQEKGFFYHFLKMDKGTRDAGCELSPIDTALFLAGAFFISEYLDDPHLKELTQKIYDRVDWEWMLNGGTTLALAWSPEQKFSRLRWDHYNESMIMYFMAIASKTHPIPASSWLQIERPVGSYKNYRLLQMPPLFTHQYSHIWIDFRGKNDGIADYFQNSVQATLANKAYCMDKADKSKSYGPDSWGLTASDGPNGYKAYGAPPGWATADGTLAPTGCGSSIVFTPKESISCLRYFYEKLGKRLWGKYGFADAFNLDRNWISPMVIGIDQGALLLMIENYRSGLIWKIMAKQNWLKESMDRVGFVSGAKELEWPEPPVYKAVYASKSIIIDSLLADWPNVAPIILDSSYREAGQFSGADDAQAEIRFLWDDRALYFSLKMADNSVVMRRQGKTLWQDDLFEFYVDPQGDGLDWGSYKDFQIGIRPIPGEKETVSWSWFQGGEDPQQAGFLNAKGYTFQKGYTLEGKILWKYLKIEPEPNAEIRIGTALNDVDADRSQGKLQWFFRNEEKEGRFKLGKMILLPQGQEA